MSISPLDLFNGADMMPPADPSSEYVLVPPCMGQTTDCLPQSWVSANDRPNN